MAGNEESQGPGDLGLTKASGLWPCPEGAHNLV